MDADLVISGTTIKTALDSTVAYLTVSSIGGVLNLRFTGYRNTDFEDWAFTGTPVDSPAFIQTNALTGGDFSVNKQSPLLGDGFRRNRESDCQ